MSRLDKWLANGLMISDGAWGTQLQLRGLASGTTPDTWNLAHADQVEAVARAYVEAGSQVILTNTFRANAVAMHSSTVAELDDLNRAGVEISKRAAGKRALVFASIGPTGKILMSGEVAPAQVSAAFAAQAQSLAAAGADALLNRVKVQKQIKCGHADDHHRQASGQHDQPEHQLEDVGIHTPDGQRRDDQVGDQDRGDR